MKADRDLKKLNPHFRLKVGNFLCDARTKELGVFITEGFRSKERQEYLYASGRTRPGAIVTWTLDSMHCKGQAIDIACSDPKLGLYPKRLNWWSKVFLIAYEHGIASLYTTHGVDKPHLQYDYSTKPTQEYINNDKIMKKIFPKQLEVVINANSVLWNLTENPELQGKLEEMNSYLRGLKNDT